LQVNNLEIVNLETDYAIEIETASLRDFVAKGDSGIAEFGTLEIKSNMIEVSTEASSRWPESSSAKLIRGRLQSQISERLKTDVDFAVDIDFGEQRGRQTISMFENRWVQEISPTARSIQLTNFNPSDYFQSNHILPSNIQLTASLRVPEGKAEEQPSSDSTDEDEAWTVAPGSKFQLGQTTFEIESVEGNRAPLRSIVGKATVNGETIVADLRCRDYFQKGRIDLKVADQLADRTDWAHVIFGAEFETLPREEQRVLESTMEYWRASEKEEQPAAGEDEERDEDADGEAPEDEAPDDAPKAEAEESADPADGDPR
jgi:hypothetical protein